MGAVLLVVEQGRGWRGIGGQEGMSTVERAVGRREGGLGERDDNELGSGMSMVDRAVGGAAARR